MKSLLQDCKILKIEDSVSTGTAVTVSDVIDTQGYDGVCFIYKLGAVTDASVVTLQIAQGAESGMGDTADLTGASATLTGSTDSEQSLVVDIVKPRERYLQASLTIATQNSELDVGYCILYNPRKKPVSQPATIDASTQVISPAES